MVIGSTGVIDVIENALFLCSVEVVTIIFVQCLSSEKSINGLDTSRQLNLVYVYLNLGK